MATGSAERGFVFWPVGTGDTTTILVDEGVVVQVDLNHLGVADEEEDPRAPVIDELIENVLPRVDGTPYLSVFALTHPDQDHCRGFTRLLDEVEIGELWFTPRIFSEHEDDLCEDAIAFMTEAVRRVDATIEAGGAAESGHRIRIIGYDDLLQEEPFAGLPRDRLTVPGHSITELNGQDMSSVFRAFVHAPFKSDSAGERNDTSLGLQVRLLSDGAEANALLLGDLCYPTIRRIIDVSQSEDVAWNVFLAPHHCSKSVMYWKGEDDDEPVLKRDILNDLQDASGSPGYIVASSEPVPASNKPGDNPPHAKAKRRYEEVAPDGFLCTQEHPSRDNPEPIVFAVVAGVGLEKRGNAPAVASTGKTSLAAAIEAGRGGSEPPSDRVGFGACR